MAFKMKFPLCALGFLMIFRAALAQPAQDEQREVQAVLVSTFETFSTADIGSLRKNVTPDVMIYEHGVIFTLDTLTNYFKRPRPVDFSRKNFLTFLQTEVHGSIAFVGYDNRAEIHAHGKDRSLHWLESAVLVKEENRWKIKFLHSTRLDK